MRLPLDKLRGWMPGLLTALVGVACVRVAAPDLGGAGRVAVSILGYVLVPVGLAFIARRIRCDAIMKAKGP